MKNNKDVNLFFALLRAGLWEQNVRLSPLEPIDFEAVYQLADEQSVVGLVAAGLELVEDRKIAKLEALPFLRKVYSLEQRNLSMNEFIGTIISQSRSRGIFALLLKGQGVAQCYARPLWRASGDIDFCLNDKNYQRAKAFMIPIASSVEHEGLFTKHLGMTIGPWMVELHGSLRMGVPTSINRVLDEIMDDITCRGNVRTWQNGEISVFLPSSDVDAFYVFAHFFNHFYKGGIGFRQVCDWCRLLWTYREVLNIQALEGRVRRSRLMSAWRAFGVLAVDYLGMPVSAMPFYSNDRKWKRKAKRICLFILDVGNFGHNRDMSYYNKFPYLLRKAISFGRRCGDLFRHFLIFPSISLRFFPSIIYHGLRGAIRGE